MTMCNVVEEYNGEVEGCGVMVGQSVGCSDFSVLCYFLYISYLYLIVITQKLQQYLTFTRKIWYWFMVLTVVSHYLFSFVGITTLNSCLATHILGDVSCSQCITKLGCSWIFVDNYHLITQFQKKKQALTYIDDLSDERRFQEILHLENSASFNPRSYQLWAQTVEIDVSQFKITNSSFHLIPQSTFVRRHMTSCGTMVAIKDHLESTESE